MPLLAVNHHYFREAGTGRSIYPTTPSALHGEVTRLRAHGWRVGSERDILALAGDRLKRDDPVAVMTFDDGLKEQLGALTLLENVGASALYFVPTAPLVERVVLDVHKLHMIREQLHDEEMADDLDRRFGMSRQAIDEEQSTNQYPYDTPLARRVKYFLNFVLDEEQRLDWIRRTFTSLLGTEREAAESMYMNDEDVRMLAARGLLGSHGHGHVPLAMLEPRGIRHDLERSRDILRDVTGIVPVGVSYPFGSRPAMSPAVYGEAQRAGYLYGLTMTRGINGEEAVSNPFALCRINLNDLDAYVQSGAPDARVV